MRRMRWITILIALVGLSAAAMAEPVTGTVTNATTGKPAAGATVTILDPMAGMLEVGTAKADAQGHFSIDVPAARGPRLIRATRDGVHYFKMLTPGTQSADVEVYDAASKVDGIKGTADVVRLEAQGDTLQATEMFVVSNASNPPKALSAPVTFEFVLPDGAKIDDTRVQAPGGQPISAETKPTGAKNHYSFSYALKPGDTRMQVAYHMPYSGQALISPNFTREFEHYVVIVPTSMAFSPKDASQYQVLPDKQPGATVELSVKPERGQALAFTVSGTGMIPPPGESASAAGGSAEANGRPGGGLGRPEDGPDALEKYRWYILAALVTILVGGGIWTHQKTSQQAAAAAAEGVPAPAGVPPSGGSALAAPAAAAPATGQANPLLAALKEEIFALEVDLKEGKLSKEEYDKARAALDQTLERALARSKG
jgi:hypothetical protein